MSDYVFLYDGYHWDEHQKYMVGNRAALEELQQSIRVALDHGEAQASIGDLFSVRGEFIGVKCLENDFFLEHATKPVAPKGKKTLKRWAIFAVIVGPYLFGLNAIFDRVFG